MENFDVLVAGGGSAGIAAGISAARLGARTLLVEQNGSLGGMASAALVHSICGLYELPEHSTAASPDDGPVQPVLANEGFAAEFAAQLHQLGGAPEPVRMGRVYVLLQHPTMFALAADALVSKTPGLQVRLHCDLISMRADFREATISCRGRPETIAFKTVIDATGDAVAATMGGAPCEQEASERLQRPAFIFTLHDVDPAALADDARLKIASRIANAVRTDSLPAGALGAAFRSSGRGGEAFVTIDLDTPAYDPLDARSLTSLEMNGRELARAIATFLRAEVAGFEKSFIAAFPARIGVRESRRIIGRHRLETADIEQGSRFEDGIARATWPMELRETNRGAKLRYPMDGRPCDIPLGALQARDHPNLFAAGRCISTSHEAQASTRVMGTCLATGEAAGFAAALFATTGSCDAKAIREARATMSGRVLVG